MLVYGFSAVWQLPPKWLFVISITFKTTPVKATLFRDFRRLRSCATGSNCELAWFQYIWRKLLSKVCLSSWYLWRHTSIQVTVWVVLHCIATLGLWILGHDKCTYSSHEKLANPALSLELIDKVTLKRMKIIMTCIQTNCQTVEKQMAVESIANSILD